MRNTNACVGRKFNACYNRRNSVEFTISATTSSAPYLTYLMYLLVSYVQLFSEVGTYILRYMYVPTRCGRQFITSCRLRKNNNKFYNVEDVRILYLQFFFVQRVCHLTCI